MPSPFRRLTNQILSKQRYTGRILDLGGSKHSEYASYMRASEVAVTVANLDPTTEPDQLVDLERLLPFDDGSFDMVLAINVLEHVFYYDQLIHESHRVLKTGGEFLIIVPFLFQIHPSPKDFFRYTKETLQRICEENGFKEVTVTEIGSGVMAARAQLIYNFLPEPCAWIYQKMSRAGDAVLASLAHLLGKRYSPALYPLGYFVRAKKFS